MQSNATTAELFKHLSAEKSIFYRCIMDVFAAAKRQYRLQLRPDEVLAEANWPDGIPRIEEVTAALTQLTEWGNLESQPDTARVSSLSDFYRARFLYRLSHGGEAVEASLAVFFRTLQRRAELQTVALEDIANRLEALRQLIDDDTPENGLDVAKTHQLLRDLVGVFHDLAENAQAFMAGVARSLELQQAEANAVVAYKRRLIDYLDRFLGDLIRRSDSIARLIEELAPRIDSVFLQVAEREAQDAAPDDMQSQADEKLRRWRAWRERWKGLRGWFLSTGMEPPQAELLRARARAAIPLLLGAIATLNERRSGRSDRSADFRMLAHWFAACGSDGEAHRMARAAFALNPARHYSLNPQADDDLPANTPWTDAPPLQINPRLREYGEAAPRGPLPRVRDRSAERALMAEQLAEESRQVDAARQRLATGRPIRLSELGELDAHAFGLFLNLLGEALTEQAHPDQTVERQTGDGLLYIRMEPLDITTKACITTPAGVFAGRDHLLTIALTRGAA
ncbi:TIGR02677 family protein [Burkholderia ubonensis]|uniref:TIGR02677 family protein n=1 Tax=Burkholderia ubonensis TaxID=101571 RepID=UPI00016A48B6|nr:TIGR02677 family protein [Burkholderia ubonensis]